MTFLGLNTNTSLIPLINQSSLIQIQSLKHNVSMASLNHGLKVEQTKFNRFIRNITEPTLVHFCGLSLFKSHLLSVHSLQSHTCPHMFVHGRVLLFRCLSFLYSSMTSLPWALTSTFISDYIGAYSTKLLIKVSTFITLHWFLKLFN